MYHGHKMIVIGIIVVLMLACCTWTRLDVRVALVGPSTSERPVSKQARRRCSVWSRCYKSIPAVE